MKKAVVTLLVLGAVGGTVFAYYSYRKSGPAPTVNSAVVTRGDIVDTVGATGTLQAVTTVQVGSQVSGNISWLGADFNSIVKKGQVIARLDPSLFEAQVQQSRANLGQARANLTKAQSDLERVKVQLVDAQQKYTRAKELAARNLVPQSELDAAKIAVDTAQAAVVSQQATVAQTEAAVRQSEAQVNQNEVNLAHTVITAPIDGLVISRNVDVGQTVAASMQAPTLFIIAADLTKMQVVANLDESDVGRIRPGQNVHFRVDAYPAEDFVGGVSQVRLNPIVQQNVVTYATVIDVSNPDLKLKPGMTANVNVEIARRTDVLRVPNAALRFRPSNEMFAALGQTPPPDIGRGGGPGNADRRNVERGGRGAAAGGQSAASPGSAQTGARGSASSSASSSDRQPPSAPSNLRSGNGEAGRGDDPTKPSSGHDSGGRGGAGGGQFGGGESGGGQFGSQGRGGRGGFAERLQNMSPEERDRFAHRIRERAGSQNLGRDASNQGGAYSTVEGTEHGVRGGAQASSGQPQSLAARNPEATTIDALFGPLPPVESTGRVWLYLDKQLKPVRVRLGITDGQATELIEGDLKVGEQLVTNILTGNETTRPANTAFPPFMGQPRDRFPGGGGFRGGGGGGGRGRG